MESSQQKSHYQFKTKIMLSDIISVIDCNSSTSANSNALDALSTPSEGSGSLSASQSISSNSSRSLTNVGGSGGGSKENQPHNHQQSSLNSAAQNAASLATSEVSGDKGGGGTNGNNSNDGTKFLLIHCNKSLKSRDSTCKIIMKANSVEIKNLWIKAHRELIAESNFSRPFGQDTTNRDSQLSQRSK